MKRSRDVLGAKLPVAERHDELEPWPLRVDFAPEVARFQPPAYAFRLAYPPIRYVSNRLRVSSTGPPSSFGRFA
jgi:hypothetical protein